MRNLINLFIRYEFEIGLALIAAFGVGYCVFGAIISATVGG